MSNFIVKGNKEITIAEARKELGAFLIVNKASSSVEDYSQKYENLCVNTPSLVNRPTDVKALKKVLKSREGFDGAIWNAPKVARVADEDGKCYIYDGDHSRHLYNLFHSTPTMPMRVIDVQGKKEVHRLFTQANSRGKTNMTAEQIFVHDVLGGCPEETERNKDFQISGMKIFCSHEPQGIAGDSSNGYFIKYNAGKKVMDLARNASQFGAAKQTLDLLVRAARDQHSKEWQNDSSKPVPGELLGGLLLAFMAWSELRPGGAGNGPFEEWLKLHLAFATPKQVAETFKSEGGSIVNHPHYSICRGIQKLVNKDHRAFQIECPLKVTLLHRIYNKPKAKK